MFHKIFTIYDTAAKAYLPPFYSHAEGVAVRQFKDACNNPEHQFGKHPEDYTLYVIGQFDDEYGIIDVHKHEKVHSGIELVMQQKFAIERREELEAKQEAELDKHMSVGTL